MRNNRTSLRRNRIRPSQQLPQTVILQTPPPHKLDVWLPRLANFTQIALLALTAGGFYFTVLPLYQKALLDEAFARKEIELKQVTASLEDKYAKLRQVAVRAFVISAYGDCSGVREMILAPIDNPRVDTNPFDIDMKKCLFDHEASTPNLSELRDNDRAFFRTSVGEVADRLVKLQSEAAASYARADNDINDSNTDTYAEKSKFGTEMLALAVKHRLMRPEAVVGLKREQAIRQLRAERMEAYRSAVSEQLNGLKKMKWPAPQ